MYNVQQTVRVEHEVGTTNIESKGACTTTTNKNAVYAFGCDDPRCTAKNTCHKFKQDKIQRN